MRMTPLVPAVDRGTRFSGCREGGIFMPTGVYPRPSASDRFWAKVNKTGPVPDHAPHLGNCWLWTGAKLTAGYGHFSVDGRLWLTHHFLIGKPAPSFVWDHLCRVVSCVRPSHLDLVTQRENILRGVGPTLLQRRQAQITHCPQWHEYDEANTYMHGANRQCRACHREKAAERRAR